MYYLIRVNGHLSNTWSDWFDGLAITNLENGEAQLSGSVTDQAALYGVLMKLRDLGLLLVSVSHSEIDPQVQGDLLPDG